MEEGVTKATSSSITVGNVIAESAFIISGDTARRHIKENVFPSEGNEEVFDLYRR